MKDQTRIYWCRHHEKPEPLVDKCAIGVDITAMLKPHGPFGAFYRLPCHDGDGGEIPKCQCPAGGPEWFTDAELAKQDADHDAFVAAAVKRINDTAPLIARIKRGSTLSGTYPCPSCGGTLHWAMASYNRHISMRCETKDCISMME